MSKHVFLKSLLVAATGILLSAWGVEAQNCPDRANKIRFNPSIKAKNATAPVSKAPVVDSNGSVIEPEGIKLDYSESYSSNSAWGDYAEGGIKAEIYYNEADAAVYVKDLFDPYMGDCYYAAGKLIEGDMQNGIIEFSTEAPIYYSYGTFI